MVGGVTTTFAYNGDGLRVGKSVAGGASSSTVWDVSLRLPLVISDTTYVYIYGLGPIGMVDAQGNAYYFLRDGLGSVTGIVDASGTLTATYSYDAYGNLQSSTGMLPNSFRYTGEWYDGETGLYYLRARYYDPAVGRFITRDPWPGNITKPYSLNPYLYVENNPVNLIDPSGENALRLLQLALQSAQGALQWARTTAPRLVPYFQSLVQRYTQWVAVAQGYCLRTRSGAILRLSDHALDRMDWRNVTPAQVQDVLNNGTSFIYFHDGMFKTGYYDQQTRIFVAVVSNNEVRTIITNAKPQYIRNLMSLTP